MRFEAIENLRAYLLDSEAKKVTTYSVNEHLLDSRIAYTVIDSTSTLSEYIQVMNSPTKYNALAYMRSVRRIPKTPTIAAITQFKINELKLNDLKK